MTETPFAGATPEDDLLVGLTVSGRYRVRSLLGQGGMGKVYEAQQIPLGRSVALKVLDAHGVDPEFHRRFFQEAAILAKLQSRHTVSIYDYGRDGDLYFIAMELITGQPLDQVLRASGPLPVHRALQIAQEVSRSLREAHAQGVIHRDLKPANVMLSVSEEGQELAKVLDFGLAKRLDGPSADDTQTDTVPGSPKYMAPEVIRQHPVDGRADMYGLGVMLYQMLTGVVPFDHDNPMDILVAHLQTPPPPLAIANPALEVSEALERVVMRCLAKTPEQRFSGMQELLDALRAVGMSLGLHGEGSWAGTSLAPDPSVSGLRATATPSLRLESNEGQLPGSSLEQPMSRTALGAWITGILAALLLAGVGYWMAGGTSKTEPAAAAVAGTARATAPTELAAAPLPARPAAAAQPAAAPPSAEPPSMVVTAEEAVSGALPSVTLHVLSEPAGASVLVRGKWMGATPLTFTWRDPQAVQGGPLVVLLKMDGYAPLIIKRTIDAAELELSGTLIAAKQDVDLRALEARARAVEAAPEAAPVLKIAPAEPEPEPEQAPSEKLPTDAPAQDPQPSPTDAP
jgi:serine/threonine-protein kinase